MKRFHSFTITFFAAALMATGATPISVSRSASLNWEHESRLSEGKWIRIATAGTGVVKIPYSQLAEMGFQSPGKVGVYGRGGAMLPISFTDETGRPTASDGLLQVSCMHHADALYFYAQGCDPYRFTTDTGHELPGRFVRQGKNIYSDNSFYFLSDAAAPSEMERTSAPEDNPQFATHCIGLAFHESDLEHNVFENGQLFWGESLKDPGSPYKEMISLPGLTQQCKGVMECGAYVESSDKSAMLGNLEFGISGEGGNASVTVAYNSTANFRQVPGTTADITIPSPGCEVFVGYDGYDSNHICANLDYWNISYPLNPASSLSDEHPQVSFAAVTPGVGQRAVPASDPVAVAWDVTDPSAPLILQRLKSSRGFILPASSSGFRMVAMFNPDKMQPGVLSWTEIPNQDIHALASEGADFAIITLPAFESQASRLARLHETHYGQKCIVATTQQLYNEYSGGIPDIMAYRRFARMLYDSPTPVKNILLFGAIRADVRGVRKSGEEKEEYIIAFQSPNVTKRDGAMNDNDIIGVMTDLIPESQRLESLQVEVGVGVLPFLSSEEARMYVDKAERYMADDALEPVMASHLMIGCDGDSHQHEIQCLKLQQELEGFKPGHLFTTLFNDHIGNEATNRGIHDAFNSGIGMVSYIGHGGQLILTKEQGVYDYSDIRRLRNVHTPFMYFSACNITNGDMGGRGISEEMVVGTRHGLIGAITSSRTAWSGPNFELMKSFYSFLYQAEASGSAPESTTVGEAYAKTKSAINSSNELSFFLLCDPALKIPVAVRNISDPVIAASGGQKVTLSGRIEDLKGAPDRDFNGNISVRIMAPPTIEKVAGVVSGTPGSDDVSYVSETLAVGGGAVDGGQYNASILIPKHLCEEAAEGITVQLTAYDPKRHISASSRHSCAIASGQPSDIEDDRTSPWITNVEYDMTNGWLIVDTADDTALDLSTTFPAEGFSLRIDGNAVAASRCNNLSAITDISECRRTIPAGHLAKGTHVASIKVRDAAGNIHEEDRTFAVGDSSGVILTAECLNAQGTVTFGIQGGSGSGKILVYDIDGKKKFTVDVADGYAESRTDPMEAGRYRAVFVSDDGENRSNTVTLTII